MKKFMKAVFSLMALVGLMLVVSTARAQSSGTVTGSVHDPSGASIPNATVTAHNESTGTDTTRTTNDTGVYVFVLSAGVYRIEAKATGFQSVVREKVTVDALASISLDLALAVGGSNQEITVSSLTTDTIQTDNVQLGSTMRNEEYSALPLPLSQGVPRDPTTFIGLAPGVASVVLQSAGPSYTSFNGGQQEVNGLYFEDLPISFPNQMGDTRPLALGVSVDAVNQFQVEINGEKAEYQGQGFHNYVIKSGGAKFHGGVFEYFRNTVLDSKSYFYNPAKPVPPDHQNEFGGNVSGPLSKGGKLFFFFNYDAYDFNTSTASTVLSIPSLQERAGNFSALTTQLFDPNNKTCAANGTTPGTGTTACSYTAANGYPGTNILPVAELAMYAGPATSLQSYLPTPNTGVANAVVNNYVAPLKRAVTNRNITTRVDYNINQKHQLYGVYAYGKWTTDYTGNLTPTGTALPLPYTASPGIVTERPLIANIHEIWTIKPSLLNSIGIGTVRISIPITPITQAGNYPQKAGLNGLPGSGQAAKGFPAITFGGSNAPNAWSSTGPFNEWENDTMGQDSLEWIKGNHIFKFGGTYQSTQDNRANPTDGTNASFTFSNVDTGNAYASFLLGAVNSETITNNSIIETGSRFHNYSLFAQDDWKVIPSLTLNLGVRWDVFAPFGEEHNRYSFAVPSVPNPAAGGIGGALVYGQQLVPTHYKNFQPRIGLAWSADSKTVVRAGFLMANTLGTLGIGGNGPNGPGQLGLNPPTGLAEAVTGTPVYYWAQGVQLPVTPTPIGTAGFGAGNSTTNPTGAIAAAILAYPNLAGRSPVYTDWSFGVQRQLLLNFTLGATYSGSNGHFLSRYTAVGPYNNSMDPKYLALGSLLNQQETPATLAQVQAQFPSVTLPFPNFKGTISTMLLPFPQYAAPTNTGAGAGGTTCYSCDRGSSSYNSLQLTVTRALANGFETQIAYTLAKEIDDLSGTASQLGAVTGGTRNPYNHLLDRGLGVIDHRHTLHVSFVEAIPVGKGHRLDAGKYGNLVVGGWKLSGIYSFQTGMPLGVTGTACNVPGIVSTCMVNLVTGQQAVLAPVGSGNAHTGVYLNKAAFADPAPYTFGTEPRSAPYGLFAPTNWEIDTTLRKDFPIHDSVKFTLAADFFNLVNNVVFAAPGTNIDSATFGTVTSLQNQPRRIQFSGRITF